jgi:hypothetical protein
MLQQQQWENHFLWIFQKWEYLVQHHTTRIQKISYVTSTFNNLSYLFDDATWNAQKSPPMRPKLVCTSSAMQIPPWFRIILQHSISLNINKILCNVNLLKNVQHLLVEVFEVAQRWYHQSSCWYDHFWQKDANWSSIFRSVFNYPLGIFAKLFLICLLCTLIKKFKENPKICKKKLPFSTVWSSMFWHFGSGMTWTNSFFPWGNLLNDLLLTSTKLDIFPW